MVLAVSVSMASPVFAIEEGPGTIGGNTPNGGTIGGNTNSQQTFTLQNPLKVDSVGGLVKSAVEIFSYVVILIAVLMFIYVGFMYIMYAAQGNAAKIAEQHKRLMWLAIGVAVVIGARVMVEVIINTIEATGTVSPQVMQGSRDALR